MWRIAYGIVLWLALPGVLARLWWRGRNEPRYRRDLPERFGTYARAPERPVIWVHAVSVGETRAAEPLVRELRQRYPDHALLITQMTAAGRETAEQLYGRVAMLAYLPYDYPFAVRRFLTHFRPRLGVLMETEVWFNLVRECTRAGIPLLLANARMSAKSARGYGAVGALSRVAFSRLSAVAAQTADDGARLEALGARCADVTGNIKFDVAPGGELRALGAKFRDWAGSRPVFLAASTREGEEEMLLDALFDHPLQGALTVIVPRHPQRFEEVAELLAKRHVKFARRSSGLPVPLDCRVLLGDSMGEMAAYYYACDVAFVGGSLMAYGGQNLIEALACGAPVLVGPYTYNFAQAADEAVAAGAAFRVADAASLLETMRRLLADPMVRRSMSESGIAFCESHRGATARTMKIIERLMAGVPVA